MVSPDSRTDVMPEPFDFIRTSHHPVPHHHSSFSLPRHALSALDLQTLLHQLAFFRMQMIVKMESNRVTEEQDLLKSWQLVYEAEEKEYVLRCKERMAADVIHAHNKLIAMVSDPSLPHLLLPLLLIVNL
jgi:hypothetical protein